MALVIHLPSKKSNCSTTMLVSFQSLTLFHKSSWYETAHWCLYNVNNAVCLSSVVWLVRPHCLSVPLAHHLLYDIFCNRSNQIMILYLLFSQALPDLYWNSYRSRSHSIPRYFNATPTFALFSSIRRQSLYSGSLRLAAYRTTGNATQPSSMHYFN